MKNIAMQLPWTLENVPHAVLDILRGCNIQCRACSNTESTDAKPLEDIEAELHELMRMRRLQSVSIVGGECTLHPELADVVRMVRKKGLFVELFTNGVALDSTLLRKLKNAGTNVIFMHVESGQTRPDLPVGYGPEELKKLRAYKAKMVREHGIEAGLAVTVHPDRPGELEDAVRFVLESPDVVYLLVTLWRDIARMPPIQGDLRSGMAADAKEFRIADFTDTISWHDVASSLNEEFELQPFGYVGSNVDASDPRWLSFLIATVGRKGQDCVCRALRPTVVERAFLEITRKLTGRYPFWQPQSALRFGLHMFLNGLAGGGLIKNLALVFNSVRQGNTLSAKRLLFQWPASFDAVGRVVHCLCCPDAVVKNGVLVPLCICDRVDSGASGPSRRRFVRNAG